MHVDRLTLDDFGCFRNARLADLPEDLIVIGGPQRAGKTTFTTAMRQLRSGVGRGSELPPATDEYRIDAEVVHDGERLRYLLDGHAAPSVSRIDGGPGDGPPPSVDDIFGPVTARRYRQLFTISLDELQRLPPGIESGEDLAHVLLGAAYGDIAALPDVIETFDERADDIGLTKGNPAAVTGRLNGPYERIQEGLRARKDASQQVDEHGRVADELRERRHELGLCTAELAERRDELTRLNVLTELDEPVRELTTLERRLADEDLGAAESIPTSRTERLEELADEFRAATEERREAVETFERAVAAGDPTGYREWLLENADAIEGAGADASKWRADIAELRDAEADLAAEREDLETRTAACHPDWDAAVEHVATVDTDAFSVGRVRALADDVDRLADERDAERRDLDESRERLDELRERRAAMGDEQAEVQSVTLPWRQYGAVGALAVIAGSGAGVATSPIVGAGVGLAVVAAGVALVGTTIDVAPAVDAEPRRELNGQIASLESEVAGLEGTVESLEAELRDAREELAAVRDALGLPDTVPPEAVADFLETVVDLDREISAHRAARDAFEDDRAALVDELDDLATLFAAGPGADWDPEQPLATGEALLDRLDEALSHLETAREIAAAGRERDRRLGQIDDVLSDADGVATLDAAGEDVDVAVVEERVRAFAERAAWAEGIVADRDRRDALSGQIAGRFDNPATAEVFAERREDDEPWVDVAVRAIEAYPDAAALEAERERIEARVDELETETAELEEACGDLADRRAELASEADLRAAEATISEARVEYERLGEAYAVNRIAETLLEDVHQRFMAQVVDTLLDDASDVFSHVTREYDGIEIAGDVREPQFRAIRADGPDHGIDELSRATAEQLFLAVRIARIRQTEVSLPVVIDDATTNFDPSHTARLVDVLAELAGTNQVFFLTCHPAFVERLAAGELDPQCWALSAGRFERMDDATALRAWLDGDAPTLPS